MKKTGFIIVVLSAVFFSCNKSGTTSSQSYTSPVPQVMLDYGFFLPGTYWVYQDSATHATDSVYVTYALSANKSVTQQQNLGYTGIFGYYTERWMGTREAETDNLNVDMSQQPGATTSVLWMDKSIGGNFYGKNILMASVFTPGYTLYPNSEPNGSMEFISGFDSLKVGSVYYKKVIQVYDKRNSLQKNNRTNFFISKNMGIVRKELLDSNRVWNLVRSHIVQ